MGTREESRHELARWLEGVNAFITAVNRPASLRELLDLVTATACDLLGYNFCGVLLVQPEQRRLIMEGAHGLTDEYVEKLNDEVPLSLGGKDEFESPSTRAFLSARPVVVNDVPNDPLMRPWHKLARQQGYQSIVSVPLLLKGRPFGVLNCYSAKQHDIDASSVELLRILANQVATAIESIHLRDEQRANIDRLALANSSLRRQSRLLEEAEGIHKRLNDIALGASGLDDICAALQEILGRDVLIDDPHARRIAPSTEEPASFAGLPDPGLCIPMDDLEEISAVALPGNHSFTVAPLRVAGDLIARIWVNENLTNLTHLQRRALESASVIIALEILRRQATQDVEWRVRGEILEVLLHGRPSDFEALIPRAEALGHDLGRPHRFILIGFLSAHRSHQPLTHTSTARSVRKSIAWATEHIAPKPIVAVDDEYIVTLIPAATADDRQHLNDVLAIERTLRTRNSLTPLAIVGPICSNLEDYARALRLTRGAMTLQKERAEPGGVINLQDLGLVNLLLQVENTTDLRIFSARILDPIREHDASRSADLETTIHAYFRFGCSVSQTARELFVHPNTVKMRLRKIESIAGVNLADPEGALTLRSALLIDEVSRALPMAP